MRLKQLQDEAKKNNGELLEPKYLGYRTPHRVKCSIPEHNIWYAQPYHLLKRRSWCPECSCGLTENLLRTCFEQSFGFRFPKKRPLWLKNSAGNTMELDGYCEELNIAFEYQGEQHFNTGFHITTEEGLEKRKKDDLIKFNLCKEKGINLVVIPTIKYDTLYDIVVEIFRNECKNNGIDPPVKNIDLNMVFKNDANKEKLDKVKNICLSKNAVCLTNLISNVKSNINIICENGHNWKTRPERVLNGCWCKSCQGIETYTLDNVELIGKKYELKFIEFTELSGRKSCLWECLKSKHLINKYIYAIKRDNGCKECFKDNRRKNGDYSRIRKEVCKTRKHTYPFEIMLKRVDIFKEYIAINGIESICKNERYKNVAIKAFASSKRNKYRKNKLPKIIIEAFETIEGWDWNPPRNAWKYDRKRKNE